MTALNAAISRIPIPARMKHLPISENGFPTPWFVPYDQNGVAVPQAADPVKRLRAYRDHLCWCCGGKLGIHMAFTLGPMCAVNRVTAEPASHRACAEYAVRVCPFLVKPRMKRNPTTPAEHKVPSAGIMIERNPGVALIWMTRFFKPFKDHDGRVLFAVGEPDEVLFFCEGRKATRAEVLESIETGIPILREMAAKDGVNAERALERQLERALRLVPMV